MRRLSLVLVSLPFLCTACRAPQKDAAPVASASPAPAAPAKERIGVFIPVDFASISFWPEAYAGELLVLEVLPHGAAVKQGEIVARVETRAIDEQLREAELEARSAEIRHEGLERRHAIDEALAESTTAQASASLDRARRALEGWLKYELTFTDRSDQVSSRYEAANVEDQKDELAQLEAMYKADELTDATEEIVLKRSLRALAITEVSQGLQRDKRKFQKDFPQKLETEAREEAVRVQEEALARAIETQAIERRARQDAAARSAAALDQQRQKLARLRRDRELLNLSAPRDGVLLHGSLKSLRAGGAPVRYERGSQLAARSEAFLVADAKKVAVALDVPESNLTQSGSGMPATVRPVARPEQKLTGALKLEGWPGTRPAGEENAYEATIVLDEAPSDLRFGMRAKIELAEQPRSEG